LEDQRVLKHTYPLPVHHSWPLYERDRFFELGQVHGFDTLDPVPDMVDIVAPSAHRGWANGNAI
jgi:hypothetical protein